MKRIAGGLVGNSTVRSSTAGDPTSGDASAGEARPSTRSVRHEGHALPRHFHWFVRLSFVGILGAIALPMILTLLGAPAAASLVDWPFRLLCHRLPERVASLGGVAMPLCSRCAGLWIGLAVGAILAWPHFSIRTLRHVLGVAAGLLLVELVTQDFGLHPIWHATRFATGFALSLPFGGTLGWLITRELRDRVPALEAP